MLSKNKPKERSPRRDSREGLLAKRSLSEERLATPFFFSKQGLNPSFFTNNDLFNLSLTSQALDSVVNPELNQRFQHAAQELLTHVVLGNQEKAKAMIEANPKLLLIKSQAIDYSGRTIFATPFQAAIGTRDKPMWEMIRANLEPEEALRQFHEWFPDDIEDIPAAELPIDYNAIASAIINDEDHGLSVIQKFREDITSQKEIRQGKHFNLHHLIAAYQAYIDNFDALDTWENRDLFWQKVIGYVQRQMTAYDAQIHCSGVQRVLNNENLFSRTLELRAGEKFFPASIDSGLGFDFACFSCYAVAFLTVGVAREAVMACVESIEKLCRAQTAELAELRESLEQGMYYRPG